MVDNAAATDRSETEAQAESAEQDRKTVFTIGDLSREFGVTLRAIRFYEDKGLLNPRRQGMTRLYSRRDRARLKLILLGKRVGFSLVEIGEMLDLYDLKDGQTTQMKVALTKFDEQIGYLEAQRAEIDQALGDLKRARDVVQGILKERERNER
ncbi:MerR family transcriptional regulator [Microbaculum marinisediminis]|uniref:MerR family DNA-binding transcriptional regulator n=1 Tax=Microbaculum marinisediminis TaxID=2931392 RepID=A0AAW5QUU9_9HYPH|nr:MerR family DNA-binding transcriptional regulator [Microbaculum sp. A6E488]MCT8970679.1 MerR family DNA-binding transcriptional regulator [Microbaculum sp. A6E488]